MGKILFLIFTIFIVFTAVLKIRREKVSVVIIKKDNVTHLQGTTTEKSILMPSSLPADFHGETENKKSVSRRLNKVIISPVPSPLLPPVFLLPPSLTQPEKQIFAKASSFLPQATSSEGAAIRPPSPSPLPPLDEQSILHAVVKIECPAADGNGKYIGSGFALKGAVVVTAAHVVKDSGSQTCTVIFPNERRPIYYLHGALEDLRTIQRRHDEKGIDVAVLKLPKFSEYPDAVKIFQNDYPFIPYPICTNPALLDDETLHFGYPSNYADQNYLSELPGKVVVFGDITGIEDRRSLEGNDTYKSPILSYMDDTSLMHPYLLSRVPSFYGDSGGLTFDKTKQCIIGLHRGGTIGRGAGENYSLIMVLGWEGTSEIIGQ